MLHKICPVHIIATQVSRALEEDLSVFPDWTANLIDAHKQITAQIRTKEDMLVCGVAWVEQAFKICDPLCTITWFVIDGAKAKTGDILCEINGNARALMTAERTAINFLQTLSGVATLTSQYVEKVKGTKVQIMDTRKTLPGMRLAQKYAVVVGGGHNQRNGLYDGILIKENHIAACGGVAQVLQLAKDQTPTHIPIQIEVETIAQLEEALAHDAKLILLDNMSLDTIKTCVKLNHNRAKLEVSGNVTLENVLDYAQTGVDRISIGGLTKNVKAIDLSMRVINS